MDQDLLELFIHLSHKSTLVLAICEQSEVVRNLELKSYNRALPGSDLRVRYEQASDALDSDRKKLRETNDRINELVMSSLVRLAA